MSKRSAQSRVDDADNVIYANFGARKRVSSAAETEGPEPTAVAAAAGESLSPAAMRMVNAAVRQTDVGRAQRGQQYAANGHVADLRVRSNRIEGFVTGSQNEPFFTAVSLPPRTPTELRGALEQLAAMAGGMQRVERGEFPAGVLDVLLASSPEEFRFVCDCPDNAVVCKHGVALAQVAAQRIDADPAMMFALRDLSFGAVEETILSGAHSIAADNAAEGSTYFWSGRALPDLPHPKVAPMIEDSDMDLLHRAMQTVSFTNIDQLRAVADIEDLYDVLVNDTEPES